MRTILRVAILMLISTSLLQGTSSAIASERPVKTLKPYGIFDSACSGRNKDFIIKFFRDSGGRDIPLKCGVTSAWGYRYINANAFDGYDDFADTAITVAIEDGTRSSQGGGIYTYDYLGDIVFVDVEPSSDGVEFGVTQWQSGTPTK